MLPPRVEDACPRAWRHARSTRARRLTCGVALLAALTTHGVAAQDRPRLEAASARVQIAVDGDDADVLLRYGMIVTDAAGSIALRAIPFFGLAVADVDATVDGEPAHIELATAASGAQEGRVVAATTFPSERVIVLELRYRVPGAVVRVESRRDVRVPVLLPDATAGSSAEGFFDAELLAPRGLALTESFPTVPVGRQSGAGGERFTMTLQVVPALLRWRVAVGPAPRLSFAATIDLAVLVVMFGLAVAGAAALRRRN